MANKTLLVYLKFSAVMTAAFLLMVSPPVEAAGVHGILRVVKGKVQVKSGRNGKVKRARIGQKVYPKDVILTGKNARAKVVMVDENEINVSPNSKLEIESYEYEPSKKKKNVFLNVIYGKVRSKVKQKYNGKTSRFQIKTKTAVAGVRGTDFFTSFNPRTEKTQVVTFEGEVKFGLPGPRGEIRNAVSVRVGQMTSNVAGKAPDAPKAVPKTTLAQLNEATDAETSSANDEGSDGGERQPSTDETEEGGDEGDEGDSKDKNESRDEGEEDENKKKADDKKRHRTKKEAREGDSADGSLNVDGPTVGGVDGDGGDSDFAGTEGDGFTAPEEFAGERDPTSFEGEFDGQDPFMPPVEECIDCTALAPPPLPPPPPPPGQIEPCPTCGDFSREVIESGNRILKIIVEHQ